MGKGYKNVNNLYLSDQNLLVKKTTLTKTAHMLQEYCIVYSNELKTEYNKYV